MPTFYRSRPPVVAGGRLCGSTAPAPNGDFFQPGMGTGTASTNDSPAGATGVSGNSCISIWPTTRIWNTLSSTARWSGPTPALRERPLEAGKLTHLLGAHPCAAGAPAQKAADLSRDDGPPLRCGSAPKRAAKQPRPWDGAAAGSAPRST